MVEKAVEGCRSFAISCVSDVNTNSKSKFKITTNTTVGEKHELFSEQTFTLTIDHVDYTTSSRQTSRFTSSTVEGGYCVESRK